MPFRRDADAAVTQKECVVRDCVCAATGDCALGAIARMERYTP